MEPALPSRGIDDRSFFFPSVPPDSKELRIQVLASHARSVVGHFDYGARRLLRVVDSNVDLVRSSVPAVTYVLLNCSCEARVRAPAQIDHDSTSHLHRTGVVR